MRSPKDNASGTDGLEELENDAIVAQETAAHAPQPRANVQVDQPSVVISEQAHDARPRRPRGSNDKTLVIRDRRAVDEVRRKIAEDQRRRERARKLRVAAFWILGGLVAFGIGSAFALYWGDESANTAGSASAVPSASAPPPESQSASAPAAQPAESAHAPILDLDTASAQPSSSAKPARASAPDRVLKPDQLPLEPAPAPAKSAPVRKRVPSSVVNDLPF